MSVREAINGYHAAHKQQQRQFNGLYTMVVEKFGTVKAFGDALGYVNSGSLYGSFKPSNRSQRAAVERWAKILGVTPEEVIAAKKQPAPNVKRKSLAQPVPSSDLTPPRQEVTSRTEKFSLTVNADGTAAVKLDMTDLPLDVALKLVQVLELPGLLNPRLRITHTNKDKTDGT